ncbi:unnamed protein product [Moneuplotes crassus]|uniref:PHD-type domain-containing protein n=1 Tax=Euplotes crassus TaxID=5936 RepID=A0AAD1XS56_EUPCR|nr:unnamed protein product [Moneuplotes crassus]
MESSIESFFHNNIIFPNDVKRRLNTIKILDEKIEVLKERYERLKEQLASQPDSTELFTSIELIYKQMKALQQEKYDHSVTAFQMYEHALRKADKLMDDLMPEQKQKASTFPSKIADNLYDFEKLDINDYEEKPVISRKGRSTAKKQSKPISSRNNIKMEPAYPEVKQEVGDVNMAAHQEDDVTCPCGEVKNDDWVGCDMHDKCAHEWFHLNCVNLTQLPPEDSLWFCDGCQKKYKKEIEAKLKNHTDK